MGFSQSRTKIDSYIDNNTDCQTYSLNAIRPLAPAQTHSHN